MTLNKSTGKTEPLVLGIPEDRLEEMHAIRRSGWEAGRRFKLGLASSKNLVISTNDPHVCLVERHVAADYDEPRFVQEFRGNWESAR